MLCVLQLCVHLTISGCPTFPGIPLQLATSNLEIGHLSPAYLKIKVKALPQIVWQFDFLAWDRKCRSPLIIDLYSAIYTICLLGYIQLVLDQKLHIHYTYTKMQGWHYHCWHYWTLVQRYHHFHHLISLSFHVKGKDFPHWQAMSKVIPNLPCCDTDTSLFFGNY